MNYWGYNRAGNQSFYSPQPNRSFGSIPIVRNYKDLRQDDHLDRFLTNDQTRHLTPDDIVSDVRGSCFNCKRLIDDNYIRHLSIFYQIVREELATPLPRNSYKPLSIPSTSSTYGSSQAVAKNLTQNHRYNPWQWDNPYLESNVSVQSIGRVKTRDEATSTFHDFGSSTNPGSLTSRFCFQDGRQNLDNNRSTVTPIDFDNPDLYVDQILSQMNGPNDWRNEIYANDLGQPYHPLRMSEVKRIIETNVEYPLLVNGLTSPTYSSYTQPVKKLKKISKPGKDGKSSKRKTKPKKKKSKKKIKKKRGDDISSMSSDSDPTDDSNTLNLIDSDASSEEKYQKPSLKNDKDTVSANPKVDISSPDISSTSSSSIPKINKDPIIGGNEVGIKPKAEIQDKPLVDKDKIKGEGKNTLGKDKPPGEAAKLIDVKSDQGAPIKEVVSTSSGNTVNSKPIAKSTDLNKIKPSLPRTTPSIVVSSPSMTSNLTDKTASDAPSVTNVDLNKNKNLEQQGSNKNLKELPTKANDSIPKLDVNKDLDGKVKGIQTKFQLPNHPTLSSKEKIDIMGKATEIGNKSNLKHKVNSAEIQAPKKVNVTKGK